RSAVRARRRRDPAPPQASARMDTLLLDLAVPTRSFDVELALEVGAETVAIVGPSGAGKTTLLRAVAGLAPARGRIACRAETWLDSARRIDRRPEERSVGLVLREYALFPPLSAERNVGLGARRHSAPLLARLRPAPR